MTSSRRDGVGRLRFFPRRGRHRRASPRWLSVLLAPVLALAVVPLQAPRTAGSEPAAAATRLPAGSTARTLRASDDATVRRAHPTSNYGSSTGLRVDGSPVEDVLLRFVVSGTAGYRIVGATLRLHVTEGSPSGGSIHAVRSSSWSQRTVTWRTAPAADAAVIATLGPVSAGSWAQADVTPLVTGDGAVSVRLSTGLPDGASFTSRDAAADQPQLVVALLPVGTPPIPPTRTAGPSAATPCAVSRTPPARYDHVIWIVEENKTYSQVIGNTASAPYLNSLATRCARGTNYQDAGSQYSSLPNYIALTSGSVNGFRSNVPPASRTTTADNLFRQVRNAGLSERSYAEDMPGNCYLSDRGNYAPRHNPAVYYTGGGDRAACQADDVPLGSTRSGNLISDIRNDTLPSFALITPNLVHDGHNGAGIAAEVRQTDAWLSTWLPLLLDSPAYRAGRTAIIVTWDEDTPAPNVWIAPSVPAGTVSSGSGHYALLRTTEDLLGLPQLGNAATATSLRRAYNL